MAARELARAGRKVTILEARDRCGGRIHPLPAAEFGYPAEGGAEFVHGEAPGHARLVARGGAFAPSDPGHAMDSRRTGSSLARNLRFLTRHELHKALQELKDDLTVAEFLRRHFAGPDVRSVTAFHRADGRGLRRGRPGASQHLGASRRMDGWRTEYASTHRRWLWRPRRFSDCGVSQPWRCDPSRLSRHRHRSE